MESLVSAEWLIAKMDAPDLVVVDCTNYAERSARDGRFLTVSGRSNWLEGHIEGSRHADFTNQGFTGDDQLFRNTLPDPRAFADAMARLGVHEGARVVLYDDAASLWAARVWWMLRWIGFDSAAVLNGGWLGWEEAGGRVSESPAPHSPADLSVRLRPELFVTKTEVQEAMADPDTILIDGLSRGQFSGRESELGLRGHIPGAVNVPGAELVDRITETFRSDTELAPLFPADREQRAIVYCGSGIAAASVAYTMVRLGHSDVAIYMPGLQEWVTDQNAPLAFG